MGLYAPDEVPGTILPVKPLSPEKYERRLRVVMWFLAIAGTILLQLYVRP